MRPLGRTPDSGADVQATPVRTVTMTAPVVDPCAPCAKAWTQWLGKYPQYAACLQYKAQHKQIFLATCCGVIKGTMHLTPGSTYDAYMMKVCPLTAPPHPTTPQPPPTAAPPPQVLPPTPSDDELVPVSDTGGQPVSQPKSALKTWGPIVGIGLIAAVALTLANQKKGKKRRRKR
jgi:hypothetical protein